MTLEQVIQSAVGIDGAINLVDLRDRLVAREDSALDLLRLAAHQFGLPYPEIVDEVLAQTGLGTPFSDEARARIRASFNSKIAELTAQQGDDGSVTEPEGDGS